MDPIKNIKSIQANMQFLKRFQGKKSVITKDGLISSLQSDPLPPYQSPRKIRINQSKLIEKREGTAHLHVQKLINTEPSADVDFSTDFLNSEIQPRQKKRTEQVSKHSNRSERPTLAPSNQSYHDLQLFRERLNRSDKLPRLAKSQSDRHMPTNHKANGNGRSISYKQKSGSLPNYEAELRKDMSAATYFKQLQKFEQSLRNLKFKTDKKVAQFIHY